MFKNCMKISGAVNKEKDNNAIPQGLIEKFLCSFF